MPATQNSTQCRQVIRATSAAPCVILRIHTALRTSAPRLVALLIALELGLLSPLSCVLHCIVQQLLFERSTIAFFLCGEHVRVTTTSSAVPFAGSDPALYPVSQIAPRALYELVALASPLITVASLLVAVLIAPSARRLARRILPPPTPPPRLSPA